MGEAAYRAHRYGRCNPSQPLPLGSGAVVGEERFEVTLVAANRTS